MKKYLELAVTLSIWSFVSASTDASRIGSTSLVSRQDVCWSNPLFAAAQHETTTWQQCSPKASVGESNTTAVPSSTEHATNDEDAEEDASSGGWSGPHACAGPYCVYAHDTFAGGRGIVIISDGEGANALANLPIMVSLAAVTSSSSNSGAWANTNTQTHGVITKEIPGKGRGFVATRPIHRGEQIMAYTPALIAQRGFLEAGVSRADQVRLLGDAVRRLPQATQVSFWKQLGQTHQAGDDDMVDVIMNNSFNLPLAGGAGPFVGNFPEVSMYNHDCRPSVAFHLEGGVVHRTQAVKSHIAGGEELSISYVDSFRAGRVRRERTRRNWGFECACAQCGLSEGLANASDHRLWRLYEVENALAMGPTTTGGGGGGSGGNSNKYPSSSANNKKAADTADQIELLLSLYAQERLLESHGASAYRAAAVNYNGLKRRELAVKFALLALESYVLQEGPQSAGVGDMVALLEAPEGHWSWGRRR